jgi:5'(3')-deoxyribonucleotidase
MCYHYLLINGDTVSQKTIVLDLDDSIANLRDPMNLALNNYTNKNIHWNDWHQFNIVELYNLNIQQFYECIIENKLLENLIPHSETKELLTDFKKAGYTVKIITARQYHPNAYEITKNWFTKYEIPHDHIVISEHGNKSNFITKEENVILVIDDSIENVAEFLKSGKAQMACLFDMPWNQHSVLPRIHNLNEIRALLNM